MHQLLFFCYVLKLNTIQKPYPKNMIEYNLEIPANKPLMDKKFEKKRKKTIEMVGQRINLVKKTQRKTQQNQCNKSMQ